ncbi:uncharacterized protein BJ171DRAFT_479066 [Polychytrium aggregatum]|uniref:uncharacterized protein n=1 Tax=Polychytrium aggregatum TaxID=110093 RepID=UPI0022FE482A|nr:uncharacterized protein BJ171DRAFT_479066 [Polychytrium aggregatum]KAI9193446.1 hypothetical protein BJ171DRAFT_479066 [Polychytrium aggregatum]
MSPNTATTFSQIAVFLVDGDWSCGHLSQFGECAGCKPDRRIVIAFLMGTPVLVLMLRIGLSHTHPVAKALGTKFNSLFRITQLNLASLITATSVLFCEMAELV